MLDIASRFGRTDSLGIQAEQEPPLRSNLFSADQMEQHGKNLASAHRLAPGRAPDRLLPRLAENERILAEVCAQLTAAVTASDRITPAAEWLLDNFYLVEEQIRTAKRHLPKGYSRELPRLAQGPSAQRPRVYDLALRGDLAWRRQGRCRRVSPASSRRTRRSRRSRSANCGPFRSCCDWR